jgi:hypothetical protein
MKPSLVILAALAILVAAVSASSRLSVAPASSATVAKSSCPFASGPRASSAGEQSLYGHIASLVRKGRRYEMRFDPAFILAGVTATRAALEDTGSSDVSNDSYTRDESHRLLTFVVPATARVTLARVTCATPSTVAKLATFLKSTKSLRPAFWIRFRIDTVNAIDQPYHP